VSFNCERCGFLRQCGGIEPATPLLDCFALCQIDHDCETCQEVCPYNKSFASRLKEVGGLRFDNLARVTQTQAELPTYVPVIHHGCKRSEPLRWPVVAIGTYHILRTVGEEYRSIVDSAEALRRLFMLAPNTQVILLGTAQDSPLERYWSYRRRDHAAGQLAGLDPLLAIGPNFSHFLDVPRTDNLFNRKRQLICLAEFSQVGISPVPHLSAVTPGDWRFWTKYLQSNGTISQVAVEFQTGNKRKTEGLKVVERIAALQDEVGRPLHPIIIGGSQFVEAVAEHFIRFTLIDSRPFMCAVKRRVFNESDPRVHWIQSPTLPGAGIDALLADNVARYTHWIESRCGASTLTSETNQESVLLGRRFRGTRRRSEMHFAHGEQRGDGP
jgi:hypothetical protein